MLTQWLSGCVRGQREERHQKGWYKRIGKMSIEAQFEELESQDGWGRLFEVLRSKSTKQAFSLTCNEARKDHNRTRNRFRDVFPYDQTRAILRPCLEKSSDYINASLINVPDASRSYICAQGPLPATVVHFWEMIWDYNCSTVVMLNSVIEKGMMTCAYYWPHQMDSDLIVDDSDVCHAFTIHLDKETVTPLYTIRQFRLSRHSKDDTAQTTEERQISHFHFTNWPDFGVPECPNAFMDFMMAVRQSGCFDRPPGQPRNPVVIHCTAGVGRTGAFVLVDVCLTLLSLYRVVDIPARLLELRLMRMGLVQTAEQLRFCYEAIMLGKKVLALETPAPESALESKLRPSSLSILNNSNHDELDATRDYDLTPSPRSKNRPELLRQEGRTPSLDILDSGQKRARADSLTGVSAEIGKRETTSESASSSSQSSLQCPAAPRAVDEAPASQVVGSNSTKAPVEDCDKREAEFRRVRQERQAKLREKIASIKQHQVEAARSSSANYWLYGAAAVGVSLIGIWLAVISK